jgi:hypothetical protein
MFGGHVITLFYWLKNGRSFNDAADYRISHGIKGSECEVIYFNLLKK